MTTRSETKEAFTFIGISLHKVTGRNSYCLQFACRACNRCTNALYPLHHEAHHQQEADRTMLRVFYWYLEVLRPSLVERAGSRRSNLLPALAIEDASVALTWNPSPAQPPPPPPRWLRLLASGSSPDSTLCQFSSDPRDGRSDDNDGSTPAWNWGRK